MGRVEMKSLAVNPPGGIHLMMDSGAFSAHMLGKEINLTEWIRFCRKLERQAPWVSYINLDVIGRTEKAAEASYLNWRTMRDAGLKPIPVFHFGTHERWLEKYLQGGVDYLAIGGLVGLIRKPFPWLDHIWTRYLLDANRMPKYKVHGLGVALWKLLRRYPWYSVDTAEWFRHSIAGRIHVPRRSNGQWDFSRRGYVVIVSNKGRGTDHKDVRAATMTPALRSLLCRYLKDHGFALGRSEERDGEEYVIEPGVSNCRHQRTEVEAMFFAKLVASFPYPRPALCGGGLLSVG